MIAAELLLEYGAKQVRFKKDDIIFDEGDRANYYYQLIEGNVKMINISTDGRHFIQGLFGGGESFGEPALLGDFLYPSTAVALCQCSLWRLSKDQFLKLLKDHFEIHLMLDIVLCERIKQKSKILSDISFYEPEQRILNFIEQLKRKFPDSLSGNNHFIVPLTRQQVADMTGMRVETVIRTVKRMEEEQKLSIVDGKIHIS